MLHVTLDGLDQVRDQVMTPCQLHVDLRKRVADTVALVDQAVVNADRPEHNGRDYAQKYQE